MATARPTSFFAPSGTPVVRFGNLSNPSGRVRFAETGDDVFAAAGFTRSLVSGAFAFTEAGDDVFAAFGASQGSVSGAFAFAEVGGDTLAFAGAVSAPPATSITLSGPPSGTVGAESAAFTVGVSPVGGSFTAPLVVTPSAGAGGGTFSPTSVTLTAGAPTAVFTYTPSSTGAKSITVTNNRGLTNPGAASFTANEVTPAGVVFTSLAVRETAGAAGTVPYTASVLPLRGQVPAGQTIVSPDDSNLRASVLSSHDDGSAALVVVAGSTALTANQSKSLRLQTAASAGGANLTTAAIAAAVTSVAVNFQGTYGSTTLSAFGSPERVWWANPGVICARYRLPAPTPGSTSLEAVIDIQAFPGGRALVEVVVENGRMTTATPTKPAGATYTGATVTVNGTTVATVSSSGAPEGNHAAFRAWYARAWIGGDPGVRVVQSHVDLQRHPLFWRAERPSTANMTTLGAKTYSVWGTGDHRASSMGAGGAHASIGPIPKWDVDALTTGDYRAWNAAEANTLTILGYTVNYRDSGTGLVPTFDQLAGKTMQSNWPSQAYDGSMGFEVAHHPAVGLMGFIARPSPVYIELAQKVSATVGTWSSTNGTFGTYYQTRGKAWCIRSLSHSIMLTPTTDAQSATWKTAAKSAMERNVALVEGFKDDPRNVLGVVYPYDLTNILDLAPNSFGTQTSLWEHHFLAAELHRAASARHLAGGSYQARIDTLADWACRQPVRWVRESQAGEWRYLGYMDIVGNDDINSGNGFAVGGGRYAANLLNQQSTWGAQRALAYTGLPSASGTWMTAGDYFYQPTSYSGTTPTWQAEAVGGFQYVEPYWDALVAAAERGVADAARAWYHVDTNITNLATWKAGFASDGRWGARPRGAVTHGGADTSVWDGGQGAAYKGNETFTTLQALYNGLSSSGGWTTIPNTTLETVWPTTTQVDAISPQPVLRQNRFNDRANIWGGGCWNGYGFFWTSPGGHFAGYMNDTYLMRLADPIGVVRMHMPAPINAVAGRAEHPSYSGAIIPQANWASEFVERVGSSTAWGPLGCHQYNGMIWHPTLEKMVFSGDAQGYIVNPTDVGQSAQRIHAVLIFDPYAPTPQKAWERIRVPSTSGYRMGCGMVLNADGTVSFRDLSAGNSRFTLNVETGIVTTGAPHPSPMADQYQSWRAAVRDPATGRTFELHQDPIGPYVASPTALYETTSGSYVKRAVLPSSWLANADNDNHSSIVIHNGRAYVANQTTGTGSGGACTITVHQIDLTTYAVQSFTSPSVSVPDLDGGTVINGLHGRFAFVPQVGGFVMFPSARSNALLFRPPAAWGV